MSAIKIRCKRCEVESGARFEPTCTHKEGRPVEFYQENGEIYCEACIGEIEIEDNKGNRVRMPKEER